MSPSPPPVERRFDGGHVGPLLSAALSWPPAGRVWQGRAALRYATLLQLLDAEVFVSRGAGRVPGGEAGRAALGLQLSGHPLFPALIWDNLAGWMIAGLHLFASLGVVRVDLRGSGAVAAVGGAGDRRTLWALRPALGAGVDLPLSGRSGRSGLWLTLRWRLRWLRVGPSAGESLELGDQALSVGVGWRLYGVGSGPSS